MTPAQRLAVLEDFLERHMRAPTTVVVPVLQDYRAALAELEVYRKLCPWLSQDAREEVARARAH